MNLSDDFINTLLAAPETKTAQGKGNVSQYELALREKQKGETQGPVRWQPKTLRCKSEGCGSPTYETVEGKPLCSVHAIARLNEMIIELQGRDEIL